MTVPIAGACTCACGCNRERRRGFATCAACGRSGHRAAMTWIAPILRAFGLSQVIDASGPDGIATNTQIRSARQSRNRRNDDNN